MVHTQTDSVSSLTHTPIHSGHPSLQWDAALSVLVSVLADIWWVQ